MIVMALRQNNGSMWRYLLFISALVLGASPPLRAQEPPAAEGAELAGPAPVILDGRTVLTVLAPYRGNSPQQRAAGIAERLERVAKDHSINLDAIHSLRIEHAGGAAYLIEARQLVLMGITEEDARAAGRPIDQMAEENLRSIREAVKRYRELRAWQLYVLRGFYTAGATIMFILLFLAVRWAHRRSRVRLLQASRTGLTATRLRSVEVVSGIAVGSVLITAISLARWVLLLIILDIYVTLVLSFFPETAGISSRITAWVLAPLKQMGSGFVDYLDELFFLIVLCLVAYYAVRISNLFFKAIEDKRIVYEGFYSDWAQPTSTLIRMLIIVLFVVAAYPYLPGSKSPAFQGISIFLGVLFSIGGSSAVANMIAGVILTYMRPFVIGDRVRIGEHLGDVVQKNFLVTRIRTIRNVVITLANVSVMNSEIVNYSQSIGERPVALNTSVTIGYGAPWRTVHQLLIDAALSTKHILREPAPFVLQNALNDFYVTYEINAYTDQPNLMEYIYAELHQNIQDKFNEGGVEIMSPHYTQLRDGNETTIPSNYLPKDYHPGGLRVESINSPRE